MCAASSLCSSALLFLFPSSKLPPTIRKRRVKKFERVHKASQARVCLSRKTNRIAIHSCFQCANGFNQAIEHDIAYENEDRNEADRKTLCSAAAASANGGRSVVGNFNRSFLCNSRKQGLSVFCGQTRSTNPFLPLLNGRQKNRRGPTMGGLASRPNMMFRKVSNGLFH